MKGSTQFNGNESDNTKNNGEDPSLPRGNG